MFDVLVDFWTESFDVYFEWNCFIYCWLWMRENNDVTAPSAMAGIMGNSRVHSMIYANLSNSICKYAEPCPKCNRAFFFFFFLIINPDHGTMTSHFCTWIFVRLRVSNSLSKLQQFPGIRVMEREAGLADSLPSLSWFSVRRIRNIIHIKAGLPLSALIRPR